MTEPTSSQPTAASAATMAMPDISMTRQLRIALASFWGSHVRNRVVLLGVALLATILVTTYGQVVLNRWNVPFYNALEQRDLDAFLHQLGVFAMIAGGLLALNVLQTYLSQLTALYMREGLSRSVVDRWLTGHVSYRLALTSPLGINPDQRLHEDVRKLAEMTTTLSIGLVQATILLASFIGVLWQVSSSITLTLAGHAFTIPGYMVWGALIYAACASLLTQLVGWRLTRLNADRYSGEANLRSALMRTNENLESIAVSRGEETERRHIHDEIDRVLGKIRSLAYALTNLTWVTAGFGWLAIIVPTLIASPAYFMGTMTFGGLMMAAAAFTQVYTALRWYVDNFGAIADWKATLYRVTVFEAALEDIAAESAASQEIQVSEGSDSEIAFIDLQIATASQEDTQRSSYHIKEETPRIAAGEKVMVNGDQGVNRKLLFDAMAGIWPYGAGEIRLPPEASILFVPQLGYLPEGRLRSVLAYPLPSAQFSDAQLEAALDRVGLSRLKDQLEERQRWDRHLDRDEQVALAFANILLRRPRWVVFHDVLEGLEPDMVETLASLIRDLPDVSMVYIGRSAAFAEAAAPRLLHLERV